MSSSRAKGLICISKYAMSCIINIRGYRSLFIPCAEFMDKKGVRTLFKLSKLMCDNMYMSCIPRGNTYLRFRKFVLYVT